MHDPHDHSPGHHHFHHHFRDDRRRRHGYPDLSTARPWVKVLTWVGTLAAVLGLVIMGLEVFSAVPRPAAASVSSDGFPAGDPFPGAHIPGGRFPDGQLSGGDRISVDGQVFTVVDGEVVGTTASRPTAPATRGIWGIGIGLFLVGFVLSAVAGLGHATSKRR
ncbi:hypothetical protein AB0425_05850 [Actinosynnema sp. NPDC051121]